MDLYARIRPDDIYQLFHGTLVLYKGRPVKVKGTGGMRLTIYDLESTKAFTVDFDPDLFKPVAGRVGMVNTSGSCVYVARTPVRRYQVGMDVHNTSFNMVGPMAEAAIRNPAVKISTLDSTDIVRAIAGEYPVFKKAFEIAKKMRGTVAFDKQFAVSFEGKIYYKTVGVVGGVPADATDVEHIRFNKPFYKILLIGEKNAEDFRDFSPSQN